MRTQPFLYNAKTDLFLRRHFALPYVSAYGLAFLTAYSLNISAPFPVALFDIASIRRVTAASLWGCIFSYPLLHLLLRSRLYLRYRTISIQIGCIILGAAMVAFFAFMLTQHLSQSPSTRNDRLLLTPFGAAWIQLMVAITVSTGTFLVLEPIRARLRFGR